MMQKGLSPENVSVAMQELVTLWSRNRTTLTKEVEQKFADRIPFDVCMVIIKKLIEFDIYTQDQVIKDCNIDYDKLSKGIKVMKADIYNMKGDDHES